MTDLCIILAALAALLLFLGALGRFIDRQVEKKYPPYQWKPCKIKGIVRGEEEPGAMEAYRRRRGA